MEDRRKVKRRYLLYYMRVYAAATRQQIGNLVDITSEGLMVLSENTLEPGTITRLRLELTEDVATKPFLEFSARSKWCKPDITPNLYNIGFEILDLEPADEAIVQRIIATFGFRDNQPR